MQKVVSLSSCWHLTVVSKSLGIKMVGHRGFKQGFDNEGFERIRVNPRISEMLIKCVTKWWERWSHRLIGNCGQNPNLTTPIHVTPLLFEQQDMMTICKKPRGHFRGWATFWSQYLSLSYPVGDLSSQMVVSFLNDLEHCFILPRSIFLPICFPWYFNAKITHSISLCPQ